MPLTMTAEREAAIRESLRLNAVYQDNGQSVAWNFLRDFRAELDIERAAHQETQAIARGLLEALDDMVRCGSQSYMDRVSRNARTAIAKAKGVLTALPPKDKE